MKIYIASKLENVDQQQELARALIADGHQITYDWGVHGPVWRSGAQAVIEVSIAELRGVQDADVVVCLMPGGRGTHVELGAALALGKRVICWSESDVGQIAISPDTCAFYWHPNVSPMLTPRASAVARILSRLHKIESKMSLEAETVASIREMASQSILTPE